MAEERQEAARRLGLTRAQGVPYYRRGLQAYDNGDLENAILDLSEAIYYDRGNAEYYSLRGLFHVESNHIEDARVDLLYALKLNKRQWLAHYAMGIIAFNDKDYPEALKSFTLACKYKPDRPEVWYYRAVTEYNMGEEAQALSSMDRAEGLFPPGDKRRKDASAWSKEIKKAAESATPPPSK